MKGCSENNQMVTFIDQYPVLNNFQELSLSFV